MSDDTYKLLFWALCAYVVVIHRFVDDLIRMAAAYVEGMQNLSRRVSNLESNINEKPNTVTDDSSVHVRH